MLKLIVLGGLLLAAGPLAALRPTHVTRAEDGAPALYRPTTWDPLPWAGAAPPLRLPNDTTLVVQYEAISCPCAQWATRPQEEEPYKRRHIYLEPADARLPVADKLWDGARLPLRVQVTGHYVSQSGYPTGYSFRKGKPEPAPVFQYRSIKVLPTKKKQ